MLKCNSESRIRFDYNDKVVESLMEIIAVYSWNYTKSIIIFFEKNAAICCVSTADSVYAITACALNGYDFIPHSVIQLGIAGEELTSFSITSQS
jgi:hypothetical protein